MPFFGSAYWFTPLNCLDTEFDAPDDVADRELCRGIMAGKVGLHPDGWSNHDPLSSPRPHFHRRADSPAQYWAQPIWDGQSRIVPVLIGEQAAAAYSQFAPPEAVRNGAGGGQGDEQHTNGG